MRPSLSRTASNVEKPSGLFSAAAMKRASLASAACRAAMSSCTSGRTRARITRMASMAVATSSNSAGSIFCVTGCTIALHSRATITARPAPGSVPNALRNCMPLGRVSVVAPVLPPAASATALRGSSSARGSRSSGRFALTGRHSTGSTVMAHTMTRPAEPSFFSRSAMTLLVMASGSSDCSSPVLPSKSRTGRRARR